VERGAFLVLEGPDGSGKSTQAGLLVRALRERGRTVEHLRDPGGTEAGEKIRAVLLGEGRLDRRTETHLFLAARAQLAAERIRPALDAGSVVVCERFTLSTVVYQGAAAEGVDGPALDRLRAAVALAAEGTEPDLVLVLDVDPARGLARKDAGGAERDRFEKRGEEFQRRVREAYLAEARRDPRAVVIPPGGPEETHARVLAEAERCLGRR